MTKRSATEGRDTAVSSRRSFLTRTVAGGMVAAGAGSALAQDKTKPAIIKSNPKNLPPNVPSWSKVLGDSVAAHPYGKPSKFEKHVVRRDVE